MSETMEIAIHDVANSEIPDRPDNTIAFLYNGSILTGEPIRDELDYNGNPCWRTVDIDGEVDIYTGVTRWVEFPTDLATIGIPAKPNPLDGTPGSIWVRPSTGDKWLLVNNSVNGRYLLHVGGPNSLPLSDSTPRRLLDQLEPYEREFDQVSGERDIDELRIGTVLWTSLLGVRYHAGVWLRPGSTDEYTSVDLAAEGTWSILVRG